MRARIGYFSALQIDITADYLAERFFRWFWNDGGHGLGRRGIVCRAGILLRLGVVRYGWWSIFLSRVRYRADVLMCTPKIEQNCKGKLIS